MQTQLASARDEQRRLEKQLAELRTTRSALEARAVDAAEMINVAHTGVREAALAHATGGTSVAAVSKARAELASRNNEAESIALQCEAITAAITRLDHEQSQAKKKCAQLCSDIICIWAPDIEARALELARELAQLLNLRHQLAGLAKEQATTANGRLTEPLSGAAGERTAFKDAIAEALKGSYSGSLSVDTLLSVKLIAAKQAA
jgi:DNA repair exonuclease SbcCD ATPase subunit